MAKFAIALSCILLVAWGAHGSVWSEIASEITSAVEFFTEKAAAKEEMIVYHMDFEAMTEYMMNVDGYLNMKAWISEWNQYEEEWRAEYGNISSCMSWGIAWKKNSLDFVFNAIGCATKELTKLTITYETALTSLEEFKSDLADIAGRAESCVYKTHTAESCLMKILKSLGHKYAESWTTLLVDVTSLVIDFSNFREKVGPGCGFEGAEETIRMKLYEAIAVTQHCITNLNSTSL